MRVLITGGTGALAREIITAAHSPDITLRSTSRRPFAASVAQTEWIGADLASVTVCRMPCETLMS